MSDPVTRAVAGFVGTAGASAADPRQPLISHLARAFDGLITETQAADLVTRLAANRGDPAEMRRILEELFEGVDAPMVALMRQVLDVGGVGTEIGWLPLEAMIKVTNGVTRGFKGPSELDHWFQRWSDWQKAAERSIEEITPENFIYELRCDLAIQRNSSGTGIGFGAHPAQNGYEQWVLAQVKRTNGNGARTRSSLGPLDYEMFTADVYMQRMAPGRRPAAALEALFGPTLPARQIGRRAISGANSPDKSDWGKMFGRTFKEPESDWRERIVELMTNHAELRARVTDAYARRFPGGVPSSQNWEDNIADYLNDALIHHVMEAGGQNPGRTLLFDKFLQDNLAGEQGTEILKLLLGSKNMREGLHSDEFVERLLDSYLTFGAVAVNMNIPWSHAAYGRLGGMFELIQKGMSRSGTVRGYVFELEVIFTAIKAHSHNADIVLQYKFAGSALDGPDLLLVTATKVKVMQMKAHKASSAVYGINGEAARQTGSDMRRFLEASFDNIDELAADTGRLDWPDVELDGHGPKQLDNTWTFYIDGRRTPDGMSARVADNFTTSAEEMNVLLRNADIASEADEGIAAILAKSDEVLFENGPTIASKLRLAMDVSTPRLTVQQVMILRMLMKKNMGDLSSEGLESLVKKARVASRLHPPLQIAFDVRTAQHLDDASHASTFAGLNTVGD